MKKLINALLLGFVILVVAMALTSCGPSNSVASTRQIAPAAESATPKEAHYCAGITKKGVRCKRRVKNEGDYCWMHQDQDKRAK